MAHKKFNNVIGDEYDLFQLVIPHHDEFQAQIGEIVHEFASGNTELVNIRVVEIGSGTGITTKVLLEADPRINVIAIDNEPKMEQSLVSLLPGRVEFILDDALEALRKMDESSVDVVASCYTIHNMPTDWRISLFKEIYRVLRTSGIVVNADKIAVDEPLLHQKMLVQQFKLFEKFKKINRGDLFIEWTKHYIEDDKIKFIEAEQSEVLVLA